MLVNFELGIELLDETSIATIVKTKMRIIGIRIRGLRNFGFIFQIPVISAKPGHNVNNSQKEEAA